MTACSALRLLLRAAPRRLLDRETRLVGEAPHDRQHRRGRLGHDPLPLEREDPLERGAHHDRDPQRGEDTEPGRVPQRAPARVLLRVRDEHRPERAHVVEQPREVRPLDPHAGRDHVGRRVPPGDLELVVVDRVPDLDDVAAEGAARLGADRDGDAFRRRVLLEARRDSEDAVERLARAPLELVEAGALECLAAEIGGDAGDRPHFGRDRVRLDEREPHRARQPFADEDGHAQRTRCVRSERRAVREACRQLLSPLSPRRLALAGSRRDRRPGREREARARGQGQPVRAARIDDHELVALDESERAAGRPDRRRDALDHRGRDLLDGERGRERRGERLQALDSASRPLLARGGERRPFLAAPHPEADAGDDDPARERHRPPDQLVARREVERVPRRREQPRPTSSQPVAIAATAPSAPTSHTATATAPSCGA